MHMMYSKSPWDPPTSLFSNHQNPKSTSNLNRDNKYILFIDADDVGDFEINELIEMDTNKDDKTPANEIRHKRRGIQASVNGIKTLTRRKKRNFLHKIGLMKSSNVVNNFPIESIKIYSK